MVVWAAFAAVVVQAQPQVTAAPSGFYEAWSAVRMAAVGRLAGAASPVGRWLRVVTAGPSSVITFEPERRVVWRVTWGPHGVVEKIAEVDGERFSRSVFTYDGAGHL